MVVSQPVKEYLKPGDDRMIMTGICLGYMDDNAPVNHISQQWAELSDYITCHGFEL